VDLQPLSHGETGKATVNLDVRLDVHRRAWPGMAKAIDRVSCGMAMANG
jgi:hypothetical protein